MTLKKIVEQLRREGHKVETYKRKDGGLYVRAIDGVKYSDNISGNKKARAMVGNVYSEALLEQRRKNAEYFKNKAVPQRRKSDVSDTIKKELAKAQRVWRKYTPRGTAGKGKPTLRKLRYTIEHYGEEEAMRQIKQATIYAKGLAYEKNVDILIERIRLFASSGKLADDWEEIINKIESMKGISFTEDMLSNILNVFYMLEQRKNDEDLEKQTLETIDAIIS